MIGPGIPNPLLLSGGDPLDEFGKIERSLRFRPSASSYLVKNLAAGSRKTWTYSAWIKRGAPYSSGGALVDTLLGLEVAANDSQAMSIRIQSDAIALCGNAAFFRWTTNVLRDVSGHFHLHIVFDTTAASPADRARIYINGVRITTFQSSSDPAPNGDYGFGQTGTYNIGRYPTGAWYSNLIKSNVVFVDGIALEPSSFGQFHPRTSQWRPRSKAAVKAIVDAGGANSFFLPFDDATSTTTLCADASSKANHWTPTNISLTPGITYDSLIDTPTTNYPTLDANFAANGFIAGNITDGGLKFAASTTYHFTPCTIPLPAAGKWYAEFIPQDTVSFIGVADLDNGSGASQNIGSGYGWYGNVIYTGNASAVIGGLPAMAANDIIGVAVDMSVPQVQWYRNGTLVATQALSNLKRYAFACGDYYAPGATSCFANFGQRPFSHLPSGYKPLCAKNLKYDGTAQTATSGTFIGNGAADGPSVYINGCPETLTINGNAVVFGVHADRLANGFKIRTASASYNAGGSNTWSATLNAAPLKSLFRFQNAKGN